MSDEKKPAVVQMTDHPWVAVDLDGCLMEDHRFPGYGPPRPGAKEAMARLRELGLKIMIFTARTHVSGLDGKFQNVNKVINEIYAWAEKHGIAMDYVWPMPKPASILCFFDDRAITVYSPHLHKNEEDHCFHWQSAINEFESRYTTKISNWLREVTPESFEVK